jgi:hypothetical protein
MEKLVHLLWRADGHDEAAHRAHLIDEVAPQLLASSAGVLGLEVLTADTSVELPKPALFMGRAAELASVVTTWVGCIDDRAPLVELLATADGTSGQVDQHLVTESVPQRFEGRDWADGTLTPGITHFSWFPQPERLSDEDFFHGWHEVHTPKTPELHPERTEYVRDTVHRVLTAGSPPVRALVQERFPLEVYADPSRLYGSDAAMEESVVDLPLYADFEDLSTRPLHQVILRSLSPG